MAEGEWSEGSSGGLGENEMSIAHILKSKFPVHCSPMQGELEKGHRRFIVHEDMGDVRGQHKDG